MGNNDRRRCLNELNRMFEKKVILAQLVWFVGTIGLILATLFLTQRIIPDEKAHYVVLPIMFGSTIFFWIWIGRYQRSKIFGPLIEMQLKNKGYTLISERPLNLEETIRTLEIRPAILVGGVPIQSYGYIARNERMLTVINEHEREMLLHVAITKTWNKTIKIEILKKYVQ